MKKLNYCVLSVLLICTFVLTACAPAASTQPAATEAPAVNTQAPSTTTGSTEAATEAPAATQSTSNSEPVTLEFWAYASMVQSGFGDYMKAEISEFESTHPNVKVNLTGKNDDDLLAGLVTSLSG
jgi:ABC-type glycerol-3-phosphate transport system substrate-binding protein